MFYIISQADDIGRLVLIYVVQLIFSFIFLFIAYKILTRNRNRLTITLSCFYLSEGFGFILGAVYLSFKVNPLVFILYFSAIYLILFGQIFLVIFILNLLKVDFKIKNQYVIIFLYAIVAFIILNIPGAISINEETNWTPIWSWSLLIILYIFSICVVVLPFMYFYWKLYRSFEDKDLKKKLKYFITGFFGIAITWFGGILYNTWANLYFNSIWNFVLPFVLIPSALIIYYAWGYKI